MTEIKKIREINIEFERVRVISNLKKTKNNCAICQATVDFISLANASLILEISESEIYQNASENLIHLNHKRDAETLVCLPSLLLFKESF